MYVHIYIHIKAYIHVNNQLSITCAGVRGKALRYCGREEGRKLDRKAGAEKSLHVIVPRQVQNQFNPI